MIILRRGPEQFEDARGTIRDILIEPFDSVTQIFTRAGCVRGNHYHLETIQWTYVLSGELDVRSQRTSTAQGSYKELPIDHAILFPGDLMVSPKRDAHAWRAMMDTTVLVFTRGPRAGKDYESDTYRLLPDERLLY